MDWKALTIAIVGGDEREQEVARLAAATGATVRAFGFPWPQAGIGPVQHTASPEEALQGADFALFPVAGISAQGALFAPSCPSPIVPDAQLLSRMNKGGHIILGAANAALESAAHALGLALHEYDKDQRLTYLRGPAIVEGLLRVLIENTPFTIHQARICVVGYGPIGSMTARALLALGAELHVATRNPTQRAAAYAAGAHTLSLDELAALAPSLDILVSTVPHAVVGKALIQALSAHCVVVDMASPPGGVDLAYAKERGLVAVWARALSRRAPVTVGASQWQGIRERIEGSLRAERTG